MSFCRTPSLLVSLALTALVGCGGTEVTLQTTDGGTNTNTVTTTVTNTNTNTTTQTVPTPGAITVDLGPDRLLSQGDRVDLMAVVGGDVDGAQLTWTWTQLAGVGIAETSTDDQLSFDAPAEVTTLLFEVEVTDAADPSRSATDRVRLLVARDAADALFVDPDVGDDANDGSLDFPFQTLEHAVTQAASAGMDLYLNSPDVDPHYAVADTIALPDGVELYGGFDANWLRDAEGAPTRIQVQQAVALDVQGHLADVFVSGLEIEALAPVAGDIDSSAIRIADVANVVLDRVVARGSNLATDPTRSAAGFRAGSSFGVRAMGVTQLEIRDSRLYGGDGATGPAGDPGGDGGDGADGANASGIYGGDGGSGGHGYDGGDGANATGGVVACTSGSSGGSGGGSGGSGGSGAVADLPAPWVICYVTPAGDGGNVWWTASAGADGGIGQSSVVFDADGTYWPEGGTDGARGTGGAGGGGGGSGAGVDLSNGGGGGGGGEGGEGGYGGTAGAGGGASIGLLATQVVYTRVIGGEIASANGGAGAPGGLGGLGGYGGYGGNGSNSGSRAGGDGGDGGTGGRGGDGGGGAGGPVAAIVAIDGVLELDGAHLVTGDAGSGQGTTPGQGGWNYGIFLDGANMLPSTATYDLGLAGNGNVVSETN